MQWLLFVLPEKSDRNWARTHNHLVRKRRINHLAKLAKWLSCVVGTYLYGAFDCMFLSCHVRVSEWIHTLKLPECQGTPCSKQVQNLKFLSDSNWTQTHNLLVRRRTLNHLAKLVRSILAPVSSKKSLDIQATTECGLTLKHVCDMIRTYSQMHGTDKYSQFSLIKCLRLKISQKSETVASASSKLRSPINIKLSYLDSKRSRFSPISFKDSEIKDFFGLYEQQRTHFFFSNWFRQKIPLLSF